MSYLLILFVFPIAALLVTTKIGRVISLKVIMECQNRLAMVYLQFGNIPWLEEIRIKYEGV